MKKSLYLCLVLLIHFSCGTTSEEVVSSEDIPAVENIPEEPIVRPIPGAQRDEIILEADASEWLVYEGEIPCSDCQAIVMRLKLENKTGQDDKSFELTETHRGTKDGNRTYQSRGIYHISFGYEYDPSTVLITLQGKDNVQRIFLQEDSEDLTLLNKDGKRVKTDENYTLLKL